ncbi:MAG: BREX-6 system BrxE protein [Woeseiaceae bacterium]
MHKSDTDKIIHTQLIIARMGEKELMNWWNTDIAYELGGADFLKRLLGNTLAPLAAGEGILKAAQLKDQQSIKAMPNFNNREQQTYSLFSPEPEIAVAIHERLRHFKRYPEDIPEEISQILDPKKDWQVEELADLIATNSTNDFTGTSFGKEIEKKLGEGITELMSQLASLVATNEKGNYVLSYYSCPNGNGL